MNRAQKKSRVEARVEDAARKAAELVAEFSDGQARTRSNFERISDVCRELVSAKPIQEPTAPRVAELGQIKFGKFPAEQTLHNAYRPMLRIWREAYLNLLDVAAPKVTPGGDPLELSHEERASLDIATRFRVQMIEKALNRSKVENDRLKAIITKNIPALSSPTATMALSPQQAEALQAWLDQLESPNSLFDRDHAGFKVSHRSRPGVLVVPIAVLEAARRVCATALPPSGILEALGLPSAITDVKGDAEPE